METPAKRRLALFGAGVLLTAVATGAAQFLLRGRGVLDAEPYAVVVGLGIGMPLLLAGAYPALTRVERLNTRVLLALAESVIGTALGAGAVALLLSFEAAAMLTVGGGAAATYLGGTAARAVVLGRESVHGERR